MAAATTAGASSEPAMRATRRCFMYPSPSSAPPGQGVHPVRPGPGVVAAHAGVAPLRHDGTAAGMGGAGRPAPVRGLVTPSAIPRRAWLRAAAARPQALAKVVTGARLPMARPAAQAAGAPR